MRTPNWLSKSSPINAISITDEPSREPIQVETPSAVVKDETPPPTVVDGTRKFDNNYFIQIVF